MLPKDDQMDRVTFRDEDFARMFRLSVADFPAAARDALRDLDAEVHWASALELSDYVLAYLKRMAIVGMKRTKEENQQAFERGWSENLERIRERGVSLENLKPGYFRGSPFLRYSDGLVVSDNEQLEFELFKVARMCIFRRFLSGFENIVELGCGSCENLFMLAEMFEGVNLYGSDWTDASLRIMEHLSRTMGRNIAGFHLDMLAPETAFQLPTGAAVITIHAFEQLGEKFDAIIDFIIDLHPAIVVQYEPVTSFYNPDALLDYLALEYCTGRGYLKGYYERLLELERQGRVKVLEAWRPGLGGVLHEASMLVWKPV